MIDYSWISENFPQWFSHSFSHASSPVWYSKQQQFYRFVWSTLYFKRGKPWPWASSDIFVPELNRKLQLTAFYCSWHWALPSWVSDPRSWTLDPTWGDQVDLVDQGNWRDLGWPGWPYLQESFNCLEFETTTNWLRKWLTITWVGSRSRSRSRKSKN